MNVDVNRPTWAYCVLRHLHSFHDNRTMVTKDIIIMMIMMIISWWQSQQLWLGTLITMAMVIDENHDIDNDVATVMNKVFFCIVQIFYHSLFVCFVATCGYQLGCIILHHRSHNCNKQIKQNKKHHICIKVWWSNITELSTIKYICIRVHTSDRSSWRHLELLQKTTDHYKSLNIGTILIGSPPQSASL